MYYKNKPLIFDKKDIPKIKKELDEEIPKITEEFNNFFKCKEPIKIKYNIEKYERGYSCSGDLYFGDRLIKHYKEIDLLVYDLDRMELDAMLKNMDFNNKDEEENQL
jgi:hypothetical protein